MIESVTAQTYPNWELCLGEFGQNKKVQKILEKYAAKDKRIKIKFFVDNKGIGENSNNCLELASGEYIALLDHDDTLSPDALFENALKLNEKKYDFLYSDKDKIDEKGNRFAPLFKPEWSPHLMYSANYLTHLNVMNKKLLEKVGAWDSSTDGAQDWDLFFKITEATDKICHIDKVLYHWRVLSTSTSLSIETKPYALQGQLNALDYHLKRAKKSGKAYHTDKMMLAVKWDKLDSLNEIIVIMNSLSDCLQQVKTLNITENNQQFRLLYSVKDCEADVNIDSIQASQEELTLALNKIVKKSNAATFTVITQPVRTNLNTINELTSWSQQSDIGFVAPLLVDHKKRKLGSMEIFGLGGLFGRLFFQTPEEVNDGFFGSPFWYRDCTLLSSEIFSVKKKHLIKYLKPESNSLTLNLSLAMIKISTDGLNNIFNPRAEVELENEPPYIPPFASDFKFLQKVGKDLLKNGDPYYNKNLSLKYLNPHLAIDENTNEKPPINFRSAVDNFHGKGVQTLADTDKVDELKFLQIYDAPGPIKDNGHNIKNINNAAWFLAGFNSVYAGLNNIFTFASYLQEKHGITNTFFIDTNKGIVNENSLIASYPALKGSKIIVMPQDISSIGNFDMAIATLWTTAYYVAHLKDVGRKCYFIQDDETKFYTPGSISALVESSYRLGLFGITNTKGLEEMYVNKYDGQAFTLTSSLSLEDYINQEVKVKPVKPYNVFFYGRPGHPRNGFELGVAALKKLKLNMGDEVKILSAGADWNPSEYGLEGIIENLGKLPVEALPSFYKEMDAALFLMFSKHPGVVPSELMASGCPVVVNQLEDDYTWNDLYINGETALVAFPTVSGIYECLKIALEDVQLRKKVIPAARNKVTNYYSNYDHTAKELVNKIISF